MTTFHRTTILIAATLTLAACGQPDGGPLDGATSVKGAHATAGPDREEFLRIGPQSLTKIVVCRDGVNVGRLEITAPAHVTNTTIQVLRPALKVERVGSIDCVAKLDVGVSGYSIDSNNRLSLQPKSGWRRHYELVGPETPDLWQEIKDGASKAKSKFQRARQKMRKAARAITDAWVAQKMWQAQMDAEVATKIFNDAKHLAKKAKPATPGHRYDSAESKPESKN